MIARPICEGSAGKRGVSFLTALEVFFFAGTDAVMLPVLSCMRREPEDLSVLVLTIRFAAAFFEVDKTRLVLEEEVATFLAVAMR